MHHGNYYEQIQRYKFIEGTQNWIWLHIKNTHLWEIPIVIWQDVRILVFLYYVRLYFELIINI